MTLPLSHSPRQPGRRATRLACTAAFLSLASAHSLAADWAWSGFGTVGYAISDKAYRYQRFINDQGSFERDTVLGGQLDVQLHPEWTATAQLTLAPAVGNDKTWSLTPSWAFVSWRPSNDWLLRLGKQRIPIYLNSENKDVGQTYDFLRLPTEVYAMAPTNDCNGLYISHNWLPALGEITLDAFVGQARMDARTTSREQGTRFLPVYTDIAGLALTLRTDAATWRLGLDHAQTRTRNGQAFTSGFPYVSMAPGVGYYAVAPGMGATLPTTTKLVNNVIMLGADIEVAPNWRVVSELARNIQTQTDLGSNTMGGYLAVLHTMGRYTPYLSVSALRSLGAPLRTVAQLDASVVPGSGAMVDGLNASQRAAADSVPVYDQRSLAIGASYALTPQSKLKAEWLHTHIGKRSTMVDSTSSSGVVRHQGINVLSLNYSFVF